MREKERERERVTKQRSDGVSQDYLCRKMQVVVVFSDFRCDCDQNICDIFRIYFYSFIF
jgi:hypothetical protein